MCCISTNKLIGFTQIRNICSEAIHTLVTLFSGFMLFNYYNNILDENCIHCEHFFVHEIIIFIIKLFLMISFNTMFRTRGLFYIKYWFLALIFLRIINTADATEPWGVKMEILIKDLTPARTLAHIWASRPSTKLFGKLSSLTPHLTPTLRVPWLIPLL